MMNETRSSVANARSYVSMNRCQYALSDSITTSALLVLAPVPHASNRRVAATQAALRLKVSAAENRRADAHERRAFLNGHLEVAAHAHRQLAKHVGRNTRRQPLIPQLAQSAEPGS